MRSPCQLSKLWKRTPYRTVSTRHSIIIVRVACVGAYTAASSPRRRGLHHKIHTTDNLYWPRAGHQSAGCQCAGSARRLLHRHCNAREPTLVNNTV
eukprot:6194734-Pleurochrysis_carterae.AAC.3